MSDDRFILLDRPSRNILGEFGSLADAKSDRQEWVSAEPDAAESLEIWHGDIRIPVDPGSLHTSPAAQRMDDFAYFLLDRASRNILGEWHTYEEAEETYPEVIRADPDAIERLELWHEDERIFVDPAKIDAVTAA